MLRAFKIPANISLCRISARAWKKSSSARHETVQPFRRWQSALSFPRKFSFSHPWKEAEQVQALESRGPSIDSLNARIANRSGPAPQRSYPIRQKKETKKKISLENRYYAACKETKACLRKSFSEETVLSTGFKQRNKNEFFLYL